MELSFLVGRLTKDPENIEGTNKTLCKLVMAVKENYTTADGERPSQFYNIAVWGTKAESCLKYLKKGSQIAVIGRNQQRKWEDENGTKHYANEVVAVEVEFLSKKEG